MPLNTLCAEVVSSFMISIVVPARNEGAVIARTLTAITTGATPGEVEVIVVCNDCVDNTASVARSFGAPVRVIETEIGSKTHALNLGDKAAVGFPRIYADADVLITIGSIRMLASRLKRGDVLAAAPRSRVDLSGCSLCVRAYYDIRSRLPSSAKASEGPASTHYLMRDEVDLANSRMLQRMTASSVSNSNPRSAKRSSPPPQSFLRPDRLRTLYS